MAQINLAMNRVNRPSVDPSRSLPFWDKFRVLLHGRLTAHVAHASWLYHAALDPRNTTEFMHWAWEQLVLDWTNGGRLWLSSSSWLVCILFCTLWNLHSVISLLNFAFCYIAFEFCILLYRF